jgi:SAM-dependent methyltransferase
MDENFGYNFIEVESCNMCAAGSRHFRVLGKRLNKSQGLKPYTKIGIAVTVCQCKVCGLIFPNPLPIPLSIQQHYGIPAEKYWNSEYLNLKNHTISIDKDKWESKLGKIHSSFRSLDIGAGIGKHMLQMQTLGIDAYGIEPSEIFYQKAIELAKIPENRLFNTSIEDAEFEPAFFDFINFGVVLEHIYNPSTAISKAISWLKPKGKIYIEVPHAKWLIGKMVNSLYKIRGLDYVTNLSPMHIPYHIYEFTPKAFQLNAKLNNYQVLSIEYFVCDTFLPPFLDSILRPIMKKTNSGMELSVWLEKQKK